MSLVHVNGSADVVAPLDFTVEQRRMIRDAYANGATDQEFDVLMAVAKARNLNPLLKQVHFVKRWDSQKRREVWSTQASIDGLRAIAERTGKYDGQDEPDFVDKDGSIFCCKVRIYRKDWTRPVVGVAHWDEYVQTTKEGNVTAFWKRMPHVMLSKCAEAIGLRKAFPEDMAGLYTPEEMGQATRPTAAEDAVEEQDLTKVLAASIDWSRWAEDHVRAFAAAQDSGELLEAWAAVNDDVKKMSPPATYVEALKAAKDEKKEDLKR